MRLEARTTQRLEQRLLPQMLQSIEVLQLATADLLQLVAQQLETNEVLDAEAAAEPLGLAADIAAATVALEPEWEAPGVRSCSDDVDGKRALLESRPAPVDVLLDTVREQLLFRELPDAVADAVVLLAGRLDERGWLPAPVDAIATETGVAQDVLQQALAELQTMEPRGLGARGGVEAMLLQAAGDPDFAVIEQLLTQHLDALARNRLPEVARALRLELDELRALLLRMRMFAPAPATELRQTAAAPVQPDVVAWLADGDVRVILADDAVPQLTVNEFYRQLLTDGTTDRQLKEHLRAKVRAANELIHAIAHRQSTLLDVATAVLRHQAAFLRSGQRALRPLRMVDVARELGLHPSTISRAIAGKYVATTFGTVPLRDFCDGGSADGSGDAGHARSAVAQHVADLVQGEDRCRPLSDDALVARLAERGIQVARRTVTKLRQAMGIPSSYRRRRHGGEGKR
jgi:RNA polymerase sigma-54 factor